MSRLTELAEYMEHNQAGAVLIPSEEVYVEKELTTIEILEPFARVSAEKNLWVRAIKLQDVLERWHIYISWGPLPGFPKETQHETLDDDSTTPRT